ncbi:MAG: serine--tRNA ligase [Candidatus Sungbacteria bacterium]|uniref:Serine--tRNA ligase n=1 Tax=Candidatus Sungiibacteriota bacterium TaxID=2750080 RepID=A0A9D6LP15_9BACT|nr:serine--tRNA ligase [Candidatus Sungbacteria bacterium]
MIDPQLLHENPELIKESLRARGIELDVDHLIRRDTKRKSLLHEVEELRAAHNKLSDGIAKLEGAEREDLIQPSKDLKETIGEKEAELKVLEDEVTGILMLLPNILAPDVPVGTSEADNVVIREVGQKPQFTFTPKDYIVLGAALNLIDTERAAKVAGARFGYLRGEAALIEFALVQFVFSVLTDADALQSIAKSVNVAVPPKPFVPVVPPVMIKPDVFEKMARLSAADKDERYYLPQDNLYLVGSAEHTLGAMHLDEILAESDLPLRYVGFSASFRREAGSYGKDTRGIMRVHQFDKVEMESFTTKEQSLAEQNFFVALQEYLMASLKIPYRVVMISSGDMGLPDARQIDLEAWMPGQNMYRETHTADLMTDYQARRLKTRIRRKNGSIELAHMNDATAFAIGRTLIAILENYQAADGSVSIPAVLQPFLAKKISRIEPTVK